jgi:hypothetical protein
VPRQEQKRADLSTALAQRGSRWHVDRAKRVGRPAGALPRSLTSRIAPEQVKSRPRGFVP